MSGLTIPSGPVFRAVWFIAALFFLGACRHPPEPPTNVLLIVVDTLRADRLTDHRSQRQTMPALADLAKEGSLFSRAYASAPWTLPSIASILTGKYPTGHGAVQLPDSLPESIPTIAEILSARGYNTAGVVSHFLVGSRWQFDQGYDVFLESEARGHDHVSTEGVTRQAEEILGALAGRSEPFFLFVHFFDPHYQYNRHPEYGFAAPSAGRIDGTESIDDLRSLLNTLNSDELDLIEALYDEDVRHTDEGIGRILKTMKQLDLYDSTLIIVTGDHGEEFASHGWIGHAKNLYDDVMRVPLVIRRPGGRGNGPATIDQPVSLVSLTPTICEMTVGTVAGIPFQARSLAPLLSDTGSDVGDPVFMEVDYTPVEGSSEQFEAHKKAIATRDFKLVRDDSSGEIELYDLRADPGELNNLADSKPKVVEDLLRILNRRIDYVGGNGQANTAIDLDDGDVERLKSLGYVGD